MTHTEASLTILQVPTNELSARILLCSAELPWDWFHAEYDFEVWLLLPKLQSFCCIIPIQLEDGTVLNCHLTRCHLDTMKTWR